MSGRAPARYEVVVAGGGPAGAAAALTLAREGRSVLLADAGTGPAKVGESLPSATRSLLRDLGAAEEALGTGHLPCYANLSAWGSSALGSVDFINDPNGPGWHLDRPLFDRGLREAARAAGARLRERTAVRIRSRRSDGGWTLALRETGRRSPAEAAVRCDWLVDATGRSRAVASRRRAGHHIGDRLFATHLQLEPAASPAVSPAGAQSSSLVESTADGWWYTTVLPGGGRLVVYFTDSDLAAPGLRSARGFGELLRQTRHIADRIAAHPFPPGVVPRRAPAHTTRLDTPHGDRWVAVGDAAATFDPVSSQGIITALYTGMTAARSLHAHLCGDDRALTGYRTGVTALFAAYERNRRTVYAQERRWADRPFWHRRFSPQGPGPTPPPTLRSFT